ncbi:insulin-degrading enzyme isoform X2 [Belonocnema kinseyi]|uniref:insulin-degrading enzyme isoform X2 n=1 Tax=Belonocnema kinseyi TaxID=2817044 RepID=UPI00143D1A44|nr:insulin-degrading enzyme isoform X2 [Belonocnema kinseyi]
MTSLNQNIEAAQVEAVLTKQNSSGMTASVPKGPPLKHVQSRCDNIVKSTNDKRDYRGLILNNQMKVLIISDPTTDKSAASLDVNVGHMSDPPELPGLAHFCEHMLFLGTKKYPEENDYNMYLSQNGGGSNAATYMDHTNYYFDINPDNLEGALDRFSQFFLHPLFTESATEREVKAVHFEHEKNLANDTWRLNQLDKSSADPKHPYSGFGTGSKDTLDIIPKQKNMDVRQELLNFHNKWYSANIMALSVLGKESLDDLEKMVVEMFADVENKSVKAPKWPEHPFHEEHFQCKWFIVPIKDVRNLNITFPIPDLQEHYRSAPAHYLSHLLGHEGEGSLLSLLKAKGWSSSLVSGRRTAARGFDFFSVYVDLTEEGLDHVDDIVTMTFQYINMLKKEGPVEWIFNEYRDIATMNFRFKEKNSPRNYVSSTVQALQEFPISEVLSAPRLFTEWRPELIDLVLGYLTPENIRVQVVAQAFEEMATEVEPWYQTKFKKEKIPASIIEKWSNAGFNSELKLPAKNEFIPTEFDIKLDNSVVDKFPVIIEDTPLMRVWFKQDDEFLLPKANLTFDFVSPLAYLDPVSCNNTYMFVQLFRDSLTEYAYAADLAGLKWELSNSKYGITLAVGGYDHKQLVLLEKIMDKMVSFSIDEKRFEILKENFIRGLKNFEAEQPYQHAVYYLAVLLAEQVWVKDELLDASSRLTVESVREFIPQLLTKMHVECLIHGNVTRDEALKTAGLIQSKLTNPNESHKGTIIPLLPSQLVLFREVDLEHGRHFLYEIVNKLHKSSCTEVYYQSGLQSTESNMLLELFAQIISEPCFKVLRTDEQLGYIVFSGIRKTNGAQGLRIIVQSDKHPKYVEERIDKFMESMQEHITKMEDEEFNKHKESLAVQRLEKPKMMGTLSAVFWNEISSQQYNFDRANIEVAYLRTITKEQILKFFENVIHANSQFRQKLSVHVVSTAEGGCGLTEETGATKKSETEEPTRISDVVSFKSSQSLYPLLQPFNNVPRKGTRSKL